jgi:hypothetical protein
MLDEVWQAISRCEDALDGIAGSSAGAELRRHLSELARLLTTRLALDLDEIDVGVEHEAAAVAVITAYLDGVERGDGFELLGDAVGATVAAADGSLTWLAAVIAALGRAAGDLAAGGDARTDDPGRAAARVQSLAQRRPLG